MPPEAGAGNLGKATLASASAALAACAARRAFKSAMLPAVATPLTGLYNEAAKLPAVLNPPNVGSVGVGVLSPISVAFFFKYALEPNMFSSGVLLPNTFVI